MPDIWLQNNDKRIDEAVALLNEHLQVGARIICVKHDAMRQPNEQNGLEAGYYRLDGPVVYNPSLPTMAREAIFIPLGLGIGLRPVIEEDGKTHQTYIDVNGDFINIATPVYTRFDEHYRGHYCVGYDRYVLTMK